MPGEVGTGDVRNERWVDQFLAMVIVVSHPHPFEHETEEGEPCSSTFLLWGAAKIELGEGERDSLPKLMVMKP